MTKKQTELSEELREAVFEAARAGAAEAYTQNTGYVNYFKAMETLLYIRGMFALLKGKGERVIYANNKTIWNNLAGIEDGNKNKLFVPNSMVDPITAGRIYGASVKVDNEIADNVIYLGTKGQVIANDYDELEIFSAIEPKTANEVKTAYSLFDAGLKNPESFVKATFVTA